MGLYLSHSRRGACPATPPPKGGEAQTDWATCRTWRQSGVYICNVAKWSSGHRSKPPVSVPPTKLTPPHCPRVKQNRILPLCPNSTATSAPAGSRSAASPAATRSPRSASWPGPACPLTWSFGTSASPAGPAPTPAPAGGRWTPGSATGTPWWSLPSTASAAAGSTPCGPSAPSATAA